MKINHIAANMNTLELSNGTEVLFSYQTPVAAFIPGKGLVKTSFKWSPTTSRHISKWLEGRKANEVAQEEIEALVQG